MPSQSDSDSRSPTPRRNPPCNALIPKNAVPYVSECLPTRMASSPQASNQAVVGVATPPRKRTRPQPQDRLSSETPVGSDPPTPIQERDNPEEAPSPKRPKKGKEKALHKEAIYDMQYSELSNDLDRVVWLLGMLEPIAGREHALKSYTLTQLEQLFSTKTGTKLYGPDAADTSVSQPTSSAVLQDTPHQKSQGQRAHIAITPAALATPRSSYQLGAVTPVPSPVPATLKRAPTTNLRIVTHSTPSARPAPPSQLASAPVPVPTSPPVPAPAPQHQDTTAADEDGSPVLEIDREAIEREYEAELREFDRVELARIQREQEAYQQARERRRLELREWLNTRLRPLSEPREQASERGDEEESGQDGGPVQHEEEPCHNGPDDDGQPDDDQELNDSGQDNGRPDDAASGHNVFQRSHKTKQLAKCGAEQKVKHERQRESTAGQGGKAKRKARHHVDEPAKRKGKAKPRRGNAPNPGQHRGRRSSARHSTSDDGHRSDRPDREDEESQDGQGGEGNRGGNDDGDGNTGDDKDGDDDDGSDDPTQPLVHYPTMRERARRKNFSPRARPLVDYLVERLHLRAVTKDPYTDITPVNSEVDEDSNVFQEGVLFDHIVVEEWARVNCELREGLEPYPLLKEYTVYAKHIYTQIRNDVKTVALGYVETSYELGLEFDPDDVMKRVESLLNDSFHSATLEPGRHNFHHPILPNCIRQAHFDVPGRAIGYKYAPRFMPMPLTTLALHCATICFLISTYESGYPYKKAPLDAANQREWYLYYLDHLKDASHPGHNPRRIRNLRKRLFDLCYRVHKPNNTPPTRPQRAYEADSEEDYVSTQKARGKK